MRRTLAVALVPCLCVIAGCGDSGEAPTDTGTARQEIAANVNAMFEAWNSGHGEEACSYLTDRGRQIMVKIVSQLHRLERPVGAGTCEGAVEESAAATDQRIGERVTSADVYFPGPGQKNAEVSSRYRGAVMVQRVGDEWLVVVPTFVD